MVTIRGSVTFRPLMPTGCVYEPRRSENRTESRAVYGQELPLRNVDAMPFPTFGRLCPSNDAASRV